MPRFTPVWHLCRRAGCCQAGLGAGTVSLALNMRARGMACCIENGMRKAAGMPNSLLYDLKKNYLTLVDTHLFQVTNEE